MTREELMQKIQEVSFCKTEAELYLDTHPQSETALAYFRDTLMELETLTDEYEGRFGPLTTDGVRGDGWTWVSAPWPWQDMTGEE